MKKESYLNVDVSVLNYAELMNYIINDIENKQKSTIIAINPEKIMKAQNDKMLLDLLNSATYNIADGIGILYASKLKKGSIKKRITGIDSMDMLCQLSNDKGYKIFMYGAAPVVVKNAQKALIEKYPQINIVGIIDGYEKNNDKIINKINKSGANILFVALGSPKQEFWINENKDKLNVNIFQGVGGSFDVFSGKVKRAPKWMQSIGLEWLYRLIKEPSRIGRQKKLFKFLFLIFFKNDKSNR
jgi:N-acetylglucosaminyldiphosphoundecaprenol N-acetyl-beta-D-mannosaminyltransferase